ncbi:TrbJ/VirB5 family protein [Burkholderia multivorans]|uniref:type IV secretion system protein n=1 Tax=Burkholderia multivorans TaxID=87883 RepID=UPI00057C7EE0|nr:type IV secretion system protein [Burkholderia multivorans]KHS09429.1 hypothetical protein BMD20_29620 [Burkholderia multivorans]KHS10374.1 hypothetical protein BMD22_28205 [Burkholderia multivorans]MDR9230053.1 Type IV secretion system protein virB5 [Burkholderia multivorans]HDR9474419.1 type IV secretion system family protein [Burkholderia multivorans]HDR9480261.1 type IV secretion system family protein [Burkholderia multivorans]
MLRKFVIAVAATFAIGAHAQGVPTYDNVAAINMAQQLVQAAQQLAQLKAQYEQIKAQFDSLNGLRDISNLLKNKLLTQFLTPDQQALLNALRSGSIDGALAGLSGTLSEIQQQNALVNCQSGYSNAAMQADCNKRWKQASLSQYVGSQGYEAAAQNIDNLQQFLSSIQSAPDPKSLQDLQARIALEQVKQQAEAQKLAMFKVMQDAQDKMDRLNASASTGKMLSTGSGIRF